MEVIEGPGGSTYVKATGIAFDITQRKRWEERQRLLVHELNHRVKNTLATVQSIAAQSFREMDAASGPRFTAFQERLFARAHDLLTRDNWEGAELGEVIVEVIEPYCQKSLGRCETEGPRHGHVRCTNENSFFVTREGGRLGQVKPVSSTGKRLFVEIPVTHGLA